MLIQPNKSIPVMLYFKQRQLDAALSELTQSAMSVTCDSYIDKNTIINFINPYFKGQGNITDIQFDKAVFTYMVEIITIQFKPGIIINQII